MGKRGGHGVEPAPDGCIYYFVADDDTRPAYQGRIYFDSRVDLAGIFCFQSSDYLAHLLVVDG